METPLVQPQLTSINEILRAHPRERLFQPPGLWMSRHLELLGCQFVDHDLSSDTSAEPSPSASSRSPNSASIAPEQTTSFSPLELPADPAAPEYARQFGKPRVGRWSYLLLLLQRTQELFRVTEHPIKFHFAGRRVTTMPGKLFYIRQDPYVPNPHPLNMGGFVPFAAYVDYGVVSHKRRSAVARRTIPSTKAVVCDNRPVDSLFRIKNSKMSPANPRRDPYIVAMAIAIAQAQRAWQPLPNGIAKTRVLTMFDAQAPRLTVFSARISETLLQGLQDPNYKFPCRGAITIECRDMDLEPYETFQDRLLDITWDDLSPPPIHSKRKRENSF